MEIIGIINYESLSEEQQHSIMIIYNYLRRLIFFDSNKKIPQNELNKFQLNFSDCLEFK